MDCRKLTFKDEEFDFILDKVRSELGEREKEKGGGKKNYDIFFQGDLGCDLVWH